MPDPTSDRQWEVFHDALAQAPDQRERWLEATCAGDSPLAALVRRLLAGHSQGERLFGTTPAGCSVVAGPGTDEPEPQVDRFTLLEPIGEGGFADVWLAEQLAPVRRRVALKLLKPGMDSRRIIARFAAEQQTLAMLDHPGIAKVHDAGIAANGRLWFAMEYIAGPPITIWCDTQCLRTRARIELFLQCCRAVQHAHERGVIHRDLKPANVLVANTDGSPQARVIDFGIAKALGPEPATTGLTERGQLLGTPEYMSPEQADGAPADTRSDVFALGVLLYELLVGQRPFGARLANASTAEILRIVRDQEPARPTVLLHAAQASDVARRRGVDVRRLVRQLRGDLEWILLRAIAKDRTRRYASVAEFGSDLERHLRGEPVLAGPPTVGYRLSRFVRRHRLGTGLAGLTLVFTVAAFVHLDTTARTERALREQAETQEQQARRSARLAEAVNQILREDVIGALDARRAPRPDITLLEAVEGAAAKLGERFAGEPLVEAAVRQTLGESLHSLGKLERAATELARAAELYAGVHGPEDEATLTAQNHLANVYSNLGRFADAERLHRSNFEARRRTLGEQHRRTLASGSNLGVNLYRGNRTLEAITVLRDVVEVSGRALGADHEDTVLGKQHLATAYSNLARHAEAEPLLREALVRHERVHGEDHPLTIAALGNLASTIGSLGQFEAAEALLQRTLRACERRLGGEHSETALARIKLGQFLIERERFADAEPLLLAGAEVLRRNLGAAHPTILSVENVLGWLYDGWKQDARAEPHYAAAADGARAQQGRDIWTRGLFLLNHGKCLHRLGRLTDAEPRLLEAHEILLATLGAAHRHTRESMKALVHYYGTAQQPDRAEIYRAKLRALSDK